MAASNEAVARWAVMASEKIRAGGRIDDVVATTAGMPRRARESAANAARRGDGFEDVFVALVPHVRFEDAAWCALAARFGRLDQGLGRLAEESAELGRALGHFLQAAVYPLAVFWVGIWLYAGQCVFILKLEWNRVVLSGLAATVAAGVIQLLVTKFLRHRPWFLVPIARVLPIVRSLILSQQWGRMVLATSWQVESGGSWPEFLRILERSLTARAPKRFCRRLVKRTPPGHHPAESWSLGAFVPREVRALAPALKSGFGIARPAHIALSALNQRAVAKRAVLMRLALPGALLIWSPAFYFLIKRMWIVTVHALDIYG